MFCKSMLYLIKRKTCISHQNMSDSFYERKLMKSIIIKKVKDENLEAPLHKKSSFSLRISSINVEIHTEEILNEKLHFFVLCS